MKNKLRKGLGAYTIVADTDFCGGNTCFQNRNFDITARIVDESGQPLWGAHVYLKNFRTKGASTDENGYFTLNEVQGGTEIVVSYTGYLAITYQVPQLPQTIRMQPSAMQLNEVTVTAKAKKKFLLWPWALGLGTLTILAWGSNNKKKQKSTTKSEMTV